MTDRDNPQNTGLPLPKEPQKPAASDRIGMGALTPPPDLDVTRVDSSRPPHGFSDDATLDLAAWSQAPVTLEIGAVLGGRYEILRLLGQGGMGAVYQARDRELDRLIALKVIRPELAGNAAILQRFKQELILARHVTHRNVVRIYDLGEADGVRFITMEYVDGTDLRTLLRDKKKFEPPEAVSIIEQVCRALEAAHAEGVIHRDLKPQNIMVDGRGRVVVMDFGLARSLSGSGMTQTGALVGTLEYMSPEQALGETLDQRSDLYTVGLIFFELLTGKVPFSGESALAMLVKRSQERARAADEIDDSVPKVLSAIVSRCLERVARDRYQTATELLHHLEAWEGHPSGATQELQELRKWQQSRADVALERVPPAKSTTWIWRAVAGAAVVAALVFAIPSTRRLILGGGTSESRGSIAPNIPDLSKGKYVAVLPFRVVGDENSLRYVADGIVEALNAKLFSRKDVHVAPLSAVETAVSGKGSLQKLARALGSNLLVQGTVQGGPGKMSVILTLHDASGDKQVWTQEFMGVPQDLLTLEDQMYGALVGALEPNASAEDRLAGGSHPTENMQAYDLYLRGRNALREQHDIRNVEKATQFFQDALNQDRNFALAYTGLADASLRLYRERKDSVWSQKALIAAQQAAKINQQLPEVHLAMGSVYTAMGQSAQALEELKKALELAPNSDEAYRRLGETYRKIGNKDEALKAYKKAIEINPYFWMNYDNLGGAYLRFGDNAHALEMYQKVTELEPDNSAGYDNIGNVYFQDGKFQECIPYYQKALSIQPHPTTYSNLGTAYFYLQRYDEAVKMFEKSVELNAKDPVVMTNLGDAYRRVNKPAQADESYTRAIALVSQELQVNPRDATALGNLALCYAKKGEKDRALENMRRARSIDKSNLELMYDEAVVHSLAGRQTQALESAREALKNGYPLDALVTDPDLAPIQPQIQALAKTKTGSAKGK